MDANTRNNLIQRLNDSKSLIDVLIQMESFLDDLDLYVYKNWFDGEIVQGPDVARHWVSITLKYPYDKMPDPEGALRLMKHSAKVYYRKDTEEIPLPVKTPDDIDPTTRKPKMKQEQIWLVEIHVPRKFIDELDDNDLDLYADEVDVDDVSDARDDGIDSSSDLKTEEGENSPDEGDTPSDQGDDVDLGL